MFWDQTILGHKAWLSGYWKLAFCHDRERLTRKELAWVRQHEHILRAIAFIIARGGAARECATKPNFSSHTCAKKARVSRHWAPRIHARPPRTPSTNAMRPLHRARELPAKESTQCHTTTTPPLPPPHTSSQSHSAPPGRSQAPPAPLALRVSAILLTGVAAG